MQRRVLELDAFRGIMLLWMTTTHLPTAFGAYVNQPFGFLSASEGFTILSAVLTGSIYSRIADREGTSAMCLKLWRRAGRLYGYHLPAVHRLWTEALGLDIPLQQTGAFDLWAWQLWWLVGQWLGVCWARNDLRFLGRVERLAVPAAAIAVAFLVLRYAQLGGLVTRTSLDGLLNKWELGAGRIVDFAAVAAVAIRWRSSLRRVALGPLVMLGQTSLDVFCVHLVCVFCALTAMGSRSAIGGWPAVALILSSWSALFVASAVVHGRRAARRAVPEAGVEGESGWRMVGWAMAGTLSVAGVVLTAM